MEVGGKRGALDAKLETRHPFSAALAHLVQPRPSTPADMDIRESLSRLKKKIQRPRAGSKRKIDRADGEAGGEGADSITSPLPSETHIVAGDGRMSGPNTGGWPVHSMDQAPESDLPDHMPAYPNESDRGGKEADADRGEISKRHWFGLGSRPSREGNHPDAEKAGRVHPSTAGPSVPQSGKPNSM